MAASTSTTPSRLRHCLNDVGYPADKDALLEAAARNGCDHETARALRAIPPRIGYIPSQGWPKAPRMPRRSTRLSRSWARIGVPESPTSVN
ncbi:MAG: DUF2795 domain-containing protein [Mycobacterium sp.]|nr:DUF2795 domain-containing protein [Mycobacterium sp.]